MSQKVPVFRASLEWRSPSTITPYHRNNKAHPTEAVEKLATHIKEYGWDVPIVVDESGVVITGHRRRLAALHLKLKEVPVIVRDDLTAEQAAARRLADNRLNDDSPYDEGAIAEELAWLQQQGIALTDTAFTQEEIGALLDNLAEFAAHEESFDEPQEGDRIPRNEPEEEETEEEPQKEQRENYPLAIVLSWADWQRWRDIKAGVGIKKDSAVMMRVLDLLEVVQGQHPEVWKAVFKGGK